MRGFLKLAEEGDTDAMCYLGFHYLHGFGVKADSTQAIYWYGKAFDAGHLWAANGLCLAYYEGEERVRDKSKALFWYMKAKECKCQNIGISEFEAAISGNK